MQITLHDLDAILPQTLVIHYRTNQEPSWIITNIEIFADSECKTLLADDIQIGMLPPSSQLSIYGAMNAWQHEQDQRRFAMKVRSEWAGV